MTEPLAPAPGLPPLSHAGDIWQGVSQMTLKQNLSGLIQSGADLLEAKLAYHLWQWTRRKPDYKTSYAKYKEGKLSGCQLLEKFGFDTSYLIEPLDPQKDPQEIHYYDKIGTQEGYKLIPASAEVSLNTFNNKNASVYRNLFKSAVQIVMPESSNYNILENGKYLTLKLDITQRQYLIDAKMDLILNHIDRFGLSPSRMLAKSQRDRWQEWENQRKVWDMRAEKKSYREIAMKLRRPNEPLIKAKDRIKKQFRAAYELIMGEKYDPKKYKEILRSKKLKSCKECPNYPCKDGCPALFTELASVEKKKLRETLVDEKKLEYLSLPKHGRKCPEKIEFKSCLILPIYSCLHHKPNFRK